VALVSAILRAKVFGSVSVLVPAPDDAAPQVAMVKRLEGDVLGDVGPGGEHRKPYKFKEVPHLLADRAAFVIRATFGGWLGCLIQDPPWDPPIGVPRWDRRARNPLIRNAPKS
jgi:hypothetical protein